jgi:hypothetical protein
VENQRGTVKNSWIGPRKLCRNLRSQFIDFIQGAEAKKYWDSKNRFGQATSADVDWEACGQAMASISLTTRHWIVKHTSGMCGTGKMMKLWKKRSSLKYPLCEAPVEDAAHVWRCLQPEAKAVWEQSIDGLREWMTKQKTHPTIKRIICETPTSVALGHPKSGSARGDSISELGGKCTGCARVANILGNATSSRSAL